MTVNATHNRAHVHGPALSFLLELLDTPAPSGYEGPAAEVFSRYAETFAVVSRDDVGNCFATVNPGASRRVMISGHLDEIGFVVTRVDDHGLLRFEGIGGWDPNVAVGQRVRVLTASGVRLGTIGRLPIHQLSDHEPALRLADLWIDIGSVNREEAMLVARPGDPVVIDAVPHVFDNRRVMSRSADNRIGCFIALEVARHCIGADVEIVAVGTTTEETAQSGAVAAAHRVQPDAAIAVDVTFTSDTPGEHDEVVTIGGGPAITFGAAMRSSIGSRMLELARARDVAVQICGSGTVTNSDADVIVAAGSGVPTGLVSVPTRYLHSPGELFCLGDVEAAIDLLVAWALDRH